MTKRALVLGGGGSKGAYQVGAYQALCELGVEFDMVVGVSIGALNGAIITQGDFSQLKTLWQHIDIDSVLNNGLNWTSKIDYYFENTQKIIPFLKSYAHNKGMDTAPLQHILEKYLDWQRLQDSRIDFGLVCLEVPSLTPREITKQHIKKGYLPKWILASASCFPAFPIYEIDGKSYIDGGYYDNLPIDLAFKMGASEVIAISLNPEFQTKYDINPLVTHIKPSMNLGTMLDFTQDSIKHNIQLGYLDTMRAFGKYQGRSFTFYHSPESLLELLRQKVNAFLRFMLAQELTANSAPTNLSVMINTQIASTGILSKVKSLTPFCDKLLSLAQTKSQKAHWQDILFLLIEQYMESFGFSHTSIWDLQDVLQKAATLQQSSQINHIKQDLLSYKPDVAMLDLERLEETLQALLSVLLDSRI